MQSWYSRRPPFLGAAFVVLLWLAGCDGQIGSPQGLDPRGPPVDPPASTTTSGATTGGSTTGGSSTTTGGMPPLDCTSTHAPPFRARLLSPTQYNNTVSDLVKVGGDPSKDFGGAVSGQLDDLSVERRANAAADVAQLAVAALAQWAPCAPPAVAAVTCEAQIIDRLGARAYRHPLEASERQELQVLFDAGVKEKDFATGVEWFLAGLLQSPDVLYQFVRLEPGEAAGEVRPIRGYEIASRLSYFLWDSTPDDALVAAADALADATRLDAELDRMLKDTRFSLGVTAFYGSWLRLGSFGEIARDDPMFNTDLVHSLETSLLMSATELYADPAPNVASLFSGQAYYLDGVMRAFYGLAGTTTGFASTDMPGQGRRGILTHPALMALFARPGETNPISRGLYLRRIVMCQDLPPPPAGVPIPPLPPITPGLSTRDRLDQHAHEPLCASCHNLIDPPGYALESFDQVGRFRSADSGRPIDTSGVMTEAGDLDGAFAKGDELLARIAESRDVRGCFAQKYFEHAVSRDVAKEDACSMDALQKSFVTSGNLKELALAIAKSDSFRYRLSEGGP
jgi:Protein of unknown function (DUF1588)/Protein of unknown function (DUF1592)/Protein of unknown function (DUF1595)/Protein of unknown function (DUF1585)